MQTMFDDDDYIFRAICSGAHGYILKSTSPAGYLESVADVHRGGAPMSSTVAKKSADLIPESPAGRVCRLSAYSQRTGDPEPYGGR